MTRRRTKEKAPPYISLFERLFSFYRKSPLFAITLTLLGFLVLAGGITLWNSRKEKEKKAWAALALANTVSDLKVSLEEYKGTCAEPWILYRLAAALYSEGDLSETTSTYEKLSREFPDHYLTGPALFILGQLYEEDKEENKARQIYAKLIDAKRDIFWAQKAGERLQGLRGSTVEVPEG